MRRAHERWALARAAEAGVVIPPAGPPVAEVREVDIPVHRGTIHARVYLPAGAGPHPALMVFHGGGWWAGGGRLGLDVSNAACRDLCSELGVVVVDVDYRLAPVHRFPVPLEDCYTATAWTFANADLLSLDSRRLAVSGTSAGANLAAAVGLLSRERCGPSLRFQQLLVPALDASLSSPSVDQNGQGYDLTAQAVALAWDYYLGQEQDRRNPLASPLWAEDLSALPATHVVVAEFDPLRDDGLRYAQRLEAAGVPTTVSRLPMGHGAATAEVAAAYRADVVAMLRERLL